MTILTVKLTLSPYTRFYESRNKWLTEIYTLFCVIMRLEPVPQVTASPETCYYLKIAQKNDEEKC